ncbi:hypothetical protein SALBM311S_01332 [Streptomyces alboniger]
MHTIGMGGQVAQSDSPLALQGMSGRHRCDEPLADDGQRVEPVRGGGRGTDKSQVDGAGAHPLDEPVGVVLQQ